MGYLEIFLQSIKHLAPLEKAQGTFENSLNSIKNLKREIDPLVEFKIINIQQQEVANLKSRVVENTTYPIWDDVLVVPTKFPTLNGLTLKIIVTNSSKLIKNGFSIGETQMDLTGLQLEQTKEVKLNLTKSGTGELFMKLSFKEELSQENIIKQGMLEKEGKINGVWRSRWFELRTTGLYWFNNSKTENLGVYKKLDQCVVISGIRSDTREVGDDKGIFFTVRMLTKNYYLKARSEKERMDWFTAFQEVGCPQLAFPPPGYSPSNPTLLPLPTGWTIETDSNGKRFFFDHNSKRSTYDDPRVIMVQQQKSNNARVTLGSISHSETSIPLKPQPSPQHQVQPQYRPPPQHQVQPQPPSQIQSQLQNQQDSLYPPVANVQLSVSPSPRASQLYPSLSPYSQSDPFTKKLETQK